METMQALCIGRIDRRKKSVYIVQAIRDLI